MRGKKMRNCVDLGLMKLVELLRGVRQGRQRFKQLLIQRWPDKAAEVKIVFPNG
ncbi:hypothetical protein GR205_06400 [Rhizobium leguminosarum]|uniref:hypothetical protein n=1 Tax=Rhizobium ruizarguesonis TaxID=2081791 RepID=UPI0013E0BF93|nr:hypothetical protein [Rhizobium ruizarguesonis]NEJ27605.1 hypothetical protein [Rhizobium ruizarguesonis]